MQYLDSLVTAYVVCVPVVASPDKLIYQLPVIMDYIKKEWNSVVSELKNMKKRQLLNSAVNLGQQQGVCSDWVIHIVDRTTEAVLVCCRACCDISPHHMEDAYVGYRQRITSEGPALLCFWPRTWLSPSSAIRQFHINKNRGRRDVVVSVHSKGRHLNARPVSNCHPMLQVVVVLSGSMEPGFKRGDILFLNMGTAPVRTGMLQHEHMLLVQPW